jgi:hypothetical protein
MEMSQRHGDPQLQKNAFIFLQHLPLFQQKFCATADRVCRHPVLQNAPPLSNK